MDKFVRIAIDDQLVEMTPENISLAINYTLEDPENFQNKPSVSAFDVVIPATANNDKVTNSFHSPSIDDLTEGDYFKNPLPVTVDVNGEEILKGRALLKKATHTNKPLSYTFNIYASNFDWFVDLKEVTLYDLIKHVQFNLNKSTISSSWNFNGTNENVPYVFAPVRYSEMFDEAPHPGYSEAMIQDYSVNPLQLKPSLSVYWIMVWMFRKVGYRIESNFIHSNFFRRLVMPWTWGNFLISDQNTMSQLSFLAKSQSGVYYNETNEDGASAFWDLEVSNDSINGAFDNSGVYEYDNSTNTCKWTYLPQFNFGTVKATFKLTIFYDVTVAANGVMELRAQLFKNGSKLTTQDDNGNGTKIVAMNAPTVGERSRVETLDIWFTVEVNPNDVIGLKFYRYAKDTGLGRANIRAEVLSWGLEYLSIPLGGNINFINYTALQKYKAIDLLRGLIDDFNLSISTDNKNRVVYMEPTHGDSPNAKNGWFNHNTRDYNHKQDLSEQSDLELFSDSDRELILKFKEDPNDGLLKKINETIQGEVGSAKYVLPERFNAGIKEYTNRFFSPVIHVNLPQWKGLGNDPTLQTQIVCIIPENISNTSRDSAANSFNPKLCYYKGLVNNQGWVFDQEQKNTYPFMFAVNYHPGGENDPVLSYSNERIGIRGNYKLGIGLAQKYFLQRFAIMRNGEYYQTHLLLNHNDVNRQHREHVIVRDQKWELVRIEGFQPAKNVSTPCFLRKYVPISQEDIDSLYPNADLITEANTVPKENDIPYNRLLALPNDINIT